MACLASKPIHASASFAFGWVGTNDSPSSAFFGSSFDIGATDS